MQWSARARFEVARRPWIRWLVVVGLAAGAGQIARTTLGDLDETRRSWGETRSVLVAAVDHEPSDTLRVRARELPLVALPRDAVTEAPAGASAKRRLVAGEIIVDDDLTGGQGPAATADAGTAVVVLPIAAEPSSIGTQVQVVADGMVIASSATVVAVSSERVHVAVPRAAAAIVADAALRQSAAVVYLP